MLYRLCGLISCRLISKRRCHVNVLRGQLLFFLLFYFFSKLFFGSTFVCPGFIGFITALKVFKFF